MVRPKRSSIALEKAERRSAIRETERRLTDFSERMLTGIATRYGKDSAEYTMAGGICKSERKPRTRKAAKPIQSVA